MSATVADFLVTRLSEWGVKRLFGYPGDGTALARDKFAAPGAGLALDA